MHRKFHEKEDAHDDNQNKSIIPTQSGGSAAASEVDSFLADLRQRRRSIVDKPLARGRLIFGLDATASRQPTWDTACQLQAEMFREATAVGGLELQLVFYRGLEECRASKWIANSEQLTKTMSQIMCNAGQTQIEKILTHTKKETKLLRVSAWSSSAMPWRRTLIGSPLRLASSGVWACPPSCSRRVTIEKLNVYFARSLA